MRCLFFFFFFFMVLNTSQTKRMVSVENMKRKASEWLEIKKELKAITSQTTAVRKKLKGIEMELVTMMTEKGVEVVDVDGKNISRHKAVVSKDV